MIQWGPVTIIFITSDFKSSDRIETVPSFITNNQCHETSENILIDNSLRIFCAGRVQLAMQHFAMVYNGTNELYQDGGVSQSPCQVVVWRVVNVGGSL